MAYCTLDDLRAEGWAVSEDDEVRAAGLCARVSEYIDLMTGNTFTPVTKTLMLDGTGLYRLDLPLCLIECTAVTCGGEPVSGIVNYNRRAPDDRMNPRLLRRERPWSKGAQNVVITGTWGCTDLNAEGEPVTPSAIRRAAVTLALAQRALLADTDAQSEEYQRRRLRSETTDGHSYTLDCSIDKLIAAETYTGIPEVDQILTRYTVRHVRVAMI